MCQPASVCSLCFQLMIAMPYRYIGYLPVPKVEPFFTLLQAAPNYFTKVEQANT